ncbi:MAG TPA: hypothetical protein VK884_03460, partial [Verrucomicrobiae bacterium]|nr:hypothetical protein [Verrucomicrobiae bacterium]
LLRRARIAEATVADGPVRVSLWRYSPALVLFAIVTSAREYATDAGVVRLNNEAICFDARA